MEGGVPGGARRGSTGRGKEGKEPFREKGSMRKEAIDTNRTPPVIGPYSKGIATRGGRMVFVSGQAGRNAEGKIIGPDVRSQTRQAFENIGAILEAAGGSLEDVVKITTYLTRAEDYKVFNEVRSQVFPSGKYPASSTILVQGLLVKDLLVEVEAIAVLP